MKNYNDIFFVPPRGVKWFQAKKKRHKITSNRLLKPLKPFHRMLKENQTDYKTFLKSKKINNQNTKLFSSSFLPELLMRHYSSKPEAVAICVLVARSSSVTFNKRSSSKIFQTRARGLQRLTTTLSTSTSMLKKIGNPWY